MSALRFLQRIGAINLPEDVLESAARVDQQPKTSSDDPKTYDPERYERLKRKVQRRREEEPLKASGWIRSSKEQLAHRRASERAERLAMLIEELVDEAVERRLQQIPH